MELAKARALATELMAQHGLAGHGLPHTDWTFSFDHATKRFGVCRFSRRHISMSAKLTLLNSEEHVRDTILHEIAHALVGTGHGHDHVWKARAKALGCNGQRCYGDEVTTPPAKWKLICANGHVYYRAKRSHDHPNYSCRQCAQAVNGRRGYDARFLLRWELNQPDMEQR